MPVQGATKKDKSNKGPRNVGAAKRKGHTQTTLVRKKLKKHGSIFSARTHNNSQMSDDMFGLKRNPKACMRRGVCMYPEVFAILGFRQDKQDSDDDTAPEYDRNVPGSQLLQRPPQLLSRKEKRQERKEQKSEARAQKRRMKEQSSSANKKQLAMGVVVKDVLEGRIGDPAGPGDTVLVKYEAKLEDGTFFASSKGRPFKVVLAEDPTSDDAELTTIPGMQIGIAGMRRGGRRDVVIPPAAGYGRWGCKEADVPPNAKLFFDITLLRLDAKEEE